MGSRTASVTLQPDVNVQSDVVHAWRLSQLVRLGMAWSAAEAVADKVDWHEVAKLVRHGCPATLAVTIIQ
jgi:hypothetical protein